MFWIFWIFVLSPPYNLLYPIQSLFPHVTPIWNLMHGAFDTIGTPYIRVVCHGNIEQKNYQTVKITATIPLKTIDAAIDIGLRLIRLCQWPLPAVVYAFHAMHPIVLNSIKRRFRGLYARHFCKIASVEVGRHESSSTRTELSEVVTKLQTPSSNVWWHFAAIGLII